MSLKQNKWIVFPEFADSVMYGAVLQNVNKSGIEREDPKGWLLTKQHHHQLKHQWKVKAAV